MKIVIKRLSPGLLHARGEGPEEWAQWYAVDGLTDEAFGLGASRSFREALRDEVARLDPEGTAKGKTILTATVVGHNGPVPWPGPASTHVDTETGKRTELGAEDPEGTTKEIP